MGAVQNSNAGIYRKYGLHLILETQVTICTKRVFDRFKPADLVIEGSEILLHKAYQPYFVADLLNFGVLPREHDAN